MCAAWAQQNMFFISYMCKHATDDVKPTMQSSHVRTRCVHNSLQMHTFMLGMHTPNLDYACMQIVNSGINSINMFMY